MTLAGNFALEEKEKIQFHFIIQHDFVENKTLVEYNVRLTFFLIKWNKRTVFYEFQQEKIGLSIFV